MKILFVSAEVSPFAKVGGLADVAGSLPKALRDLGHDVRVIMPAYQMVLDDPKYKVQKVVDGLQAKMNPVWIKPLAVHQTTLGHDVPVYLLETDQWFNEADRSEHIYGVGGDPYLFFSCAVLEAVRALDWKPDIVHCNDWHTGLIPVLMREREAACWKSSATIFTIHNFAYQGEFGFQILDQLGLPHRLFNRDQLETYGGVNFLKAGCVYADFVNTVSPRYAHEIQTPQFGCRLEGLMRHLDEHDHLMGILNGIDLEEFDPATDPVISAHYSADDLKGKAACRKALLKEVGLKDTGDPICGIVGRLSSQKGMDLIVESADELLSKAQLVILGAGDPFYRDAFHKLVERYPDRIAFHDGFHLELAPRIYAGADMFLMPSAFEPCGLGQMIAMRYGTVPLVRSTGGLANTVFDAENGYVFYEKTGAAFMEAFSRALKAYQTPTEWAKVQQMGMRGDFSWTGSAKKYVEMYETALLERRDLAKKEA